MHFQSHSILTWDIQYAAQMKALAMGGERAGAPATVILNSRCLMHLTVTQMALVCLCVCLRIHFLSDSVSSVAHSRNSKLEQRIMLMSLTQCDFCPLHF